MALGQKLDESIHPQLFESIKDSDSAFFQVNPFRFTVFELIHELIQFWIDSRLNFKNTRGNI